MIRDHIPNFMLIQETKMKKDLVGKISFSNSMDGEATNSEGASGGLLTLFNNKHFLVSTIYKIACRYISHPTPKNTNNLPLFVKRGVDKENRAFCPIN